MNRNSRHFEKRKYVRINTIFPIEFQLVGKEKREPLSELREGFTRDIGKGGMGIFTKVLKEYDKELFNFIPHETKLKLVINIPLDKEPIESFATVEWIEKQSGPIVDTYMFGVSYDFINELEYERVLDYVKWLRLKPKLIFLTIVLLAIAFVGSLVFLFKINERRIESEKKLVTSLHESRKAERRKVEAEEREVRAETAREAIEKKHAMLLAKLEKLEEEKSALEKKARLSEDDKIELQVWLEELTEERILLEEEIGRVEKEKALVIKAKEAETEDTTGTIDKERLKAEQENYNRCRELILNEKIQSLSAYVSSHRSSIYHAAALFALAELRYKDREIKLAEINYNQVVEIYPESKYALYSSHRLGQLWKNYTYEHYTLKYFHDTYNLPELFDYRKIEPYLK